MQTDNRRPSVSSPAWHVERAAALDAEGLHADGASSRDWGRPLPRVRRGGPFPGGGRVPRATLANPDADAIDRGQARRALALARVAFRDANRAANAALRARAKVRRAPTCATCGATYHPEPPSYGCVTCGAADAAHAEGGLE